MPERIAGIDFGTSTSVIRVKSYDDEGKPLGNDTLSVNSVKVNNGNSTIPTLIRKLDDAPYYGFDAKRTMKNSILHQNFKLNLESNDAGEKQQARELTKEFFTYMHKLYADQSNQGYLGEAGEKERTLISYPVKWSEETRAFMIEAAKEAGFSNVEGVDEAQASIWSVLVQCESYLAEKKYFNKDEASNILLIDMGAGTTDIVVCRYTYGENPKNEILSTWPQNADINFGGSEVDKILMDYIFSKLPDSISEKMKSSCHISDFKAWKEETVSPALAKKESVKECSFVENLLDWLDMELEEFNLDRGEFERIAADYLSNFPKLVNGAIENSGLKNEDIDLVIVTGGHSQWYFVNEMLCGSLGNINLPKIKADSGRIIPIARPQETVSAGLVYEPIARKIAALSDVIIGCQEQVDTQPYIFAERPYKQRITVFCGRAIIIPDRVKNGIDIFVVGDEMYSRWYNSDSVMELPGLQNMVDLKMIADFKRETLIGLTRNGRILQAGRNTLTALYGWKNIKAIAVGRNHIIGLKEDGTVCFAGNNDSNQGDVYEWRDIVAIAAENNRSYGLKSDGTVVMCGSVSQHWDIKGRISDIQAVSGGIVVLFDDGTVKCYMTDYFYSDAIYFDEIRSWTDIVSIAAGDEHVLGLKKDGRVVASGSSIHGQCGAADWNDIIEIYANDFYSAGIKKDGRVVYTTYRHKPHFLTGDEFELFNFELPDAYFKDHLYL